MNHQQPIEVREVEAIRAQNNANARRRIERKRERNENADRDLARAKRGWRW